jgi:hypothetical protein
VSPSVEVSVLIISVILFGSQQLVSEVGLGMHPSNTKTAAALDLACLMDFLREQAPQQEELF